MSRSIEYLGADPTERKEVRVHLGANRNQGKPRLVIQDQDSLKAQGATLSRRDARELALEILSEQFNIHYEPASFGDRSIRLTPKCPVKLGEYYVVNSQPGMGAYWQNNPLARVCEVRENGEFSLETEDGATSTWGSTMLDLEGPIKVKSRWTIVEDETPDFN